MFTEHSLLKTPDATVASPNKGVQHARSINMHDS